MGPFHSHLHEQQLERDAAKELQAKPCGLQAARESLTAARKSRSQYNKLDSEISSWMKEAREIEVLTLILSILSVIL